MKKIILIMSLLFIKVATAKQALLITDIHFNPFSECLGVPFYCGNLYDLIDKPIEKWNFGEKLPSIHREETNNFLLTNALASFKQQIDPDHDLDIFITGDILAHKFEIKYKYYRPFASKAEITQFSAKTLLYVIMQIHHSFPYSHIYFALGNNDSDNGDYNLPSSQWLIYIANGLSEYLPESQQKSFITQFVNGGYYALPLNNSIQLIGFNNNLFSAHVHNSINKIIAESELDWLLRQLKNANEQGKSVIILQHIPFGIDVFSSINSHKTVNLLDKLLQDKYLSILKRYHQNIMVIYSGHFHSEYFEVLESTIPVVGTIALNRYFGNNAGVKLVNYNDYTGALESYHTYGLSYINGTGQWLKLYSYPDDYGYTGSLASFLNNFPVTIDNPNVNLYRSSYDGNAIRYPQLIHTNKYWKNYFCFIKYVQPAEYEDCVR